MALDFEKVKAASPDDLVSLLLCEFSRAVDAAERIASAIERIAPTAEDLAPVTIDPNAEPPQCPHPAELRVNAAAMGQEPFSTFRCGVCQEFVVVPQPAGA
jgi:hypothetical protein